METKEYVKVMCKNCKKCNKCLNLGKNVTIEKVNNIVTIKCLNFEKDLKETKNFIYKKQIFFY